MQYTVFFYFFLYFFFYFIFIFDWYLELQMFYFLLIFLNCVFESWFFSFYLNWLSFWFRNASTVSLHSSSGYSNGFCLKLQLFVEIQHNLNFSLKMKLLKVRTGVVHHWPPSKLKQVMMLNFTFLNTLLNSGHKVAVGHQIFIPHRI